jgi:hypothetical protein
MNWPRCIIITLLLEHKKVSLFFLIYLHRSLYFEIHVKGTFLKKLCEIITLNCSLGLN